ncbi:phage antirepressor KilAC domain-containing protein [Limosilactobacillus oris]|jgi:anti-repressor protein|uniref:phage antirepressor KilAC domain-containing protein n=1 Tax=Limosilactobacillus oris TaxID=1632 RepID=UPI001959F23F|nr:phage antirepressor [Limosilactobacillus oris]VTX53852.1 Phage antirepressor protein KilAC domain protein [Limosilactobacillus oris]
MNQPQLFNFHGQPVRTVTINNEPYFIGKDVATILGYKKPENAIANHVEDEDKTTTLIQGTGSNYKSKSVIINESGLYSLILSSKLPQAKEFKHWVTSEVLPSIRKNGAYMTDQKAFNVLHNSNGLADLLQQAADQLKAKDVQIAEMKPKALFADAVSTSNSSILVGQLAKMIKQNGIEIGQNRLFAWLRENGYLGKRGSNRNVPTQKSVAMGLFKTKETAVTHADGHTTVQITTKVTGKGQQYFINKFLKENIVNA